MGMLVKCSHPLLDDTKGQEYRLSSDENGCSHVADCARSADKQEPMTTALSVDLTQSTRWLHCLKDPFSTM